MPIQFSINHESGTIYHFLEDIGLVVSTKKTDAQFFEYSNGDHFSKEMKDALLYSE